MNKLHKLAPEMAEAMIGEYAAEVAGSDGFTRPVYLARQVSRLLNSGISAVESPLFNNPVAIRKYLGGIDEFAHSRLSNRDSYRRLIYKADAIKLYNTTYHEAVRAKIEAGTYQRAGSFARMIPVEVNGKWYAARHMYGGYGSAKSDVAQVNTHAAAAQKVGQTPGLEHVAAISYANGITIAPLIDGRPFRNMKPDEMAEVSDDQVHEMYRNMKQAELRGVGFDGIGSNLLYSKDSGFTWVDLAPADKTVTASSPEQALKFEVHKTLDSMPLSAIHQVADLQRIVRNLKTASFGYNLQSVNEAHLLTAEKLVEERINLI